jgi:hypothetical protein
VTILTGGCACGSVRFEITAPLGRAGYCHCHRCQRRTRVAASAQARVGPGSFIVTEGEELIRRWSPDRGFVKGFCSRCGGQLFSHHPTDIAIMTVRLGSLDGDPGVRPSFRQRVESAAGWEPLRNDGLPRYSGPRPGIADPWP